MPELTFPVTLSMCCVQSNLCNSLTNLTSPNSSPMHTLSTVMVRVRANVGIHFDFAGLAQSFLASSWGSVWITLFQSCYLLLQRAQISCSSLDYVFCYFLKTRQYEFLVNVPLITIPPISGLGTGGHN